MVWDRQFGRALGCVWAWVGGRVFGISQYKKTQGMAARKIGFWYTAFRVWGNEEVGKRWVTVGPQRGKRGRGGVEWVVDVEGRGVGLLP